MLVLPPLLISFAVIVSLSIYDSLCCSDILILPAYFFLIFYLLMIFFLNLHPWPTQLLVPVLRKTTCSCSISMVPFTLRKLKNKAILNCPGVDTCSSGNIHCWPVFHSLAHRDSLVYKGQLEKQAGLLVKSPDIGVRRCHLQIFVGHLGAPWYWTSHLTSVLLFPYRVVERRWECVKSTRPGPY